MIELRIECHVDLIDDNHQFGWEFRHAINLPCLPPAGSVLNLIGDEGSECSIPIGAQDTHGIFIFTNRQNYVMYRLVERYDDREEAETTMENLRKVGFILYDRYSVRLD